MEGQLSFFNEAEFLATPAEPEPTLKQAVGGYARVSRKPKAKWEDIIGNLPVTQVICEVSGKKESVQGAEPSLKQSVRTLSVKNLN